MRLTQSWPRGRISGGADAVLHHDSSHRLRRSLSRATHHARLPDARVLARDDVPRIVRDRDDVILTSRVIARVAQPCPRGRISGGTDAVVRHERGCACGDPSVARHITLACPKRVCSFGMTCRESFDSTHPSEGW